MRRREFIAGLGGAAVSPLAARAQHRARARLIALLIPYLESDVNGQARVRAFRQELTRLGWPEVGAVQFDVRWTGDDMDHVQVAAANFVALRPDVIFSGVLGVLTQLTRSIPIVKRGHRLPGRKRAHGR